MLPCYIIDRTLGADVLRDIRTMVTGVGFGFLMIVVGIVLGYFVGILIDLDRVQGRRTFALASGCHIFRFTAVPVVEILWGGSAVALLFVHNPRVEVVMCSVGVMLISGSNGIP